jgi:hypothetical protein
MGLEEVWHRYNTANREYRRQLARTPAGQPADPKSALAHARQAEAAALAEYLRVLRSLNQMAPERTPPDERAWQI